MKNKILFELHLIDTGLDKLLNAVEPSMLEGDWDYVKAISESISNIRKITDNLEPP
ncbi:MAG: hypothetical protein ACXADW_23140 [Candidatus Hodarchaeales archaeon]|jgi:hypothetical protein